MASIENSWSSEELEQVDTALTRIPTFTLLYKQQDVDNEKNQQKCNEPEAITSHNELLKQEQSRNSQQLLQQGDRRTTTTHSNHATTASNTSHPLHHARSCRQYSSKNYNEVLNRFGIHEDIVPTYTCCDFIWTVSGIAFYLGDVASDCYVAYLHYKDNNIWWFSLTLVWVIAAALIMSIFSFWWYIQDHRTQSFSSTTHSPLDDSDCTMTQMPLAGATQLETSNADNTCSPSHHDLEESVTTEHTSAFKWFYRSTFVCLLIAPVIRYAESITYGIRICRGGDEKLPNDQKRSDLQHKNRSASDAQCEAVNMQQKAWYAQMLSEDRDSMLLRLMESFIEAAPQLVLQLYILMTQGRQEGLQLVVVQVICCVSALCSLSWSLAGYHRVLRLSLLSKANMSWGGSILQFTWRFFTIACRVIAFAFFASVFKLWLFVLIFVHYVAMLVWIVSQKTTFCNEGTQRHPKSEFFFNCIAAIVYIFCFLNLVEGATFSRYLLFYIVVYTENVVMCCVAWHYSEYERWYHIVILLLVSLGFFVGIFFQVVYYTRCHPNKTRKRRSINCGLCLNCTSQNATLDSDNEEIPYQDNTSSNLHELHQQQLQETIKHASNGEPMEEPAQKVKTHSSVRSRKDQSHEKVHPPTAVKSRPQENVYMHESAV